MSIESHCPNCQSIVAGNYCPNCGQQQKGINRFFLTMMNEAFEDVFRLNSRVVKTIGALLFRPGYLTREYLKGRRASYIRPIKLYFITSILFFVLLSIANFFTDALIVKTSQEQQARSEQIQETQTASVENVPEEGAPISIETGDQEIEEVLSSLVGSDSNWIQLFGKNLEILRSEVNQNPKILSSLILDFAPPVIFCFLPLFALLLKLSYLTKRFYFAEHLVLALHNHSFLFLVLALNIAIGTAVQKFPALVSGLDTIVLLWLPIYMWLSLKFVYQQSGLVTSVKFSLLGICYLSLLVLGVLLCLLFGVMTI